MRSGKETVSAFGIGGVEQSLGRGWSGGLGFAWACFTSLPAVCLTFSPLKSKAAGSGRCCYCLKCSELLPCVSPAGILRTYCS